MDYKLKAISNNVNNNDTIVDLIPKPSDKSEVNKDSPADHVCKKNIPVIFASLRGIHLRKFNKSLTNNYSITFCDVERWVRTPLFKIERNCSWTHKILIKSLNFRISGITSSRLDWRHLPHHIRTIRLVNQLKLCKRRMEIGKRNITSLVKAEWVGKTYSRRCKVKR